MDCENYEDCDTCGYSELCEQESEDDFEDYEEREYENMISLALTCTCGAWQLINNKPVHCADCCCGAE